jgi:hypothetical protein
MFGGNRPGASADATGARVSCHATAADPSNIAEATDERHRVNRLRFLALRFGLHGATASTVARLAWGAGKWT